MTAGYRNVPAITRNYIRMNVSGNEEQRKQKQHKKCGKNLGTSIKERRANGRADRPTDRRTHVPNDNDIHTIRHKDFI